MGLDMYLRCNHRELTEDVFAKRVELGYENEKSYHRTDGIICYWRKANAVHRWFVENVQGDEDNCYLYHVDLDDLEKLRDTCKKVLDASELIETDIVNGYTYKDGERVPIMERGRAIKDYSVAEELLPTQEGFFFGSTSYDQWYYSDIEETYKTLDLILSNFEKNEKGYYPWDATYGDTDWRVSFTYQSSW